MRKSQLPFRAFWQLQRAPALLPCQLCLCFLACQRVGNPPSCGLHHCLPFRFAVGAGQTEQG